MKSAISRCAFAILLAILSVAPSSLGARPWLDTTDGVYVFNDQLNTYMGDDLIEFSATHYAGCQNVPRLDADALRSYNPDFLILHYRLALGLGYREPDAQGVPGRRTCPIITWPLKPSGQARLNDGSPSSRAESAPTTS